MDYSYALFTACVLGAVALYWLMPRPAGPPRFPGWLLGAAALGGLWLYLHNRIPGLWGPARAASLYYYLFSALAIGSAVRVITHTRPVYAALWFVMVVLSSAGLFLLVGAPFMALAMVIIYGGAILVTYVFVIMLAAQASDPDKDPDAPMHDRAAREPAAAVIAGFLLLAMLSALLFKPVPRHEDAALAAQRDQKILRNTLVHRADKLVAQKAGDADQKAALAAAALGDPRPSNVERIGLDLFEKHPLGLELAGVILLVSLVGAVVIARQRVEEEKSEERREKSDTDPERTQGASGCDPGLIRG